MNFINAFYKDIGYYTFSGKYECRIYEKNINSFIISILH